VVYAPGRRYGFPSELFSPMCRAISSSRLRNLHPRRAGLAAVALTVTPALCALLLADRAKKMKRAGSRA